jgi:hypothetical protein
MTEPNDVEYRSYLLRLWRNNEGSSWRAMLEQIGTRQRHGFADLDKLCAFLHAQTERPDRPGERAIIHAKSKG